MSWVNDLASGLGIPAGAATLAVALYLGCAAAEKVARPEALRDIGRILKYTSWERSVRPSAIIQRMFVWTFGEPHISLHCILASTYATVLFCGSFGLIVAHITKRQFYGYPLLAVFVHPVQALSAWTVLALFTLVPDYIALGKTRLLTKVLATGDSTMVGLQLVALDVTLSGLISLTTAYALYFLAVKMTIFLIVHTRWNVTANFWDNLVLNNIFPTHEATRTTQHYQPVVSVLDVGNLLRDTVLEPFRGKSPVLSWFSVAFWSTMMTSIWTILILLSTTILKLLAPLQRFTGWFFDVDKHPVKAIGIVSAALVMIGSLAWTVLRAVF